ncbi:hypothetical protein L6164_010539 [Bauhinia variegata]|uniref:Uncharacterized protein n=1 Tax=Bauhinia variegata TaxID=167791 RepID=A0ACB9PMS2_BAUVA|nr:hypothetical protein L6164_010539 [Bauhinia variegata]
MQAWRVHPPDQRLSSNGVLRIVLVWVGLCFLVFFTLGLRRSSSIPSRCPPCDCSCSSSSGEYLFRLDPLDCAKRDPAINEETSKDLPSMLSEELNLQKIVANETLARTKKLVIDAGRASSHYQKEAQKCSVGIETCEEARERAEAELIEERNLSVLWEKRARQYGWKEEQHRGNTTLVNVII